jgi:SAM-dependent methyltransferase
MQGYGTDTYGERWADIYDSWYSLEHGEGKAQRTAAALAELAAEAGGGRVLELAIGTGRVALPLAARGLAVHGIDASAAMVAKLRAKPGGDTIPVTIGNFADVAVEGMYDLIFVVFNTFFALTTQEEQVRCLENVARHLTPTGVFVIEAFVPDPGRLYVNGQALRTLQVTTDSVRLLAAAHDGAAQTVQFQTVVISTEGLQLYPVFLRYAWPSEIDLMARLAGLELRARWAGWDRSPFTAASTDHVSVYGRAGSH